MATTGGVPPLPDLLLLTIPSCRLARSEIAFDRMTSVVQGQTTLQSMTYGPDSKRLSLTDSSGTRKFFYDGNDAIQEYNSAWSTVTKEYTHGPWVDEPLSMTDRTAREAGDTYYLMKDRLGSIINILDESETLKTTYSYDAFGDPTTTHHSGQVDCMYRFTGRVFDGASGNYFYRARYYNQSLGRFFSRDPIMGLGSLYSYCGNSPENYRDPSGMFGTSTGGGPPGTSMGMIHPDLAGTGWWPPGLPKDAPCVTKGDVFVIDGKTYTSTGKTDSNGNEEYIAEDGSVMWIWNSGFERTLDVTATWSSTSGSGSNDDWMSGQGGTHPFGDWIESTWRDYYVFSTWLNGMTADCSIFLFGHGCYFLNSANLLFFAFPAGVAIGEWFWFDHTPRFFP